MGQAYIGAVVEINDIPNADKIVSATVVCGKGGKWTGVVQKGEWHIGALCEVYLQDALLPQDDSRFAFMEKHGFRVRIQRLRGAPSECLIMPPLFAGEIGDDITLARGVTKYEKPMPLQIAGDAVGAFPGFIPKTDEINFQAARHLVDALRGKRCYASEKADGTSSTAFWYKGAFGCCTRNMELKERNAKGVMPAVWMIARKYDLENKMSGMNVALQWETVGPKIQGNPMGLSEIEPRLFDVYDIDAHEYYSPEGMIELARHFEIPTVGVLCAGCVFDFTDDERLRKFAEGLYPNGRQREGAVFRNMGDPIRIAGERLSFKVINLLYKEAK